MTNWRAPYRVGNELVLWAHSGPGAVGDIKKHNGEVVRVSKVINMGSSGTYYECEHIVSNRGVPFSISHDWLWPLGTPNIPLTGLSWEDEDED